MPTKDLAEEVKEKGTLFAKNAHGKYGAPKWMKEKAPTSIAIAKPAHMHDEEKQRDVNPYLVPVNSSEVQPTDDVQSKSEMPLASSNATTEPSHSLNPFTSLVAATKIEKPSAYVPSKTGEPSAALTATAGPSAGSDTITLAGSLATKSNDLEHAVYFESWGKPQERTGLGMYWSTTCLNNTNVLIITAAAAGKRKVIITGFPAWDTIPKPDFIASLVFGGPLEQITCLISSAIVTFIKPEDAQAYYDATPNGIIFRHTPDGPYTAEVKLHEDVTPVSSLVQQYVDNGATRCVKAIGFDVVTPLGDLYRLGRGPVNSRGQIPRRLERLTDDMTLSGVSTPS